MDKRNRSRITWAEAVVCNNIQIDNAAQDIIPRAIAERREGALGKPDQVKRSRA